MEWIFIGIAIAIGFYIAPIVITVIFGVFLAIIGIIVELFSKK
ncbi:MAG: hypothetical protein RBQ81_08405 [Arcobacteraceae bacterium]|jgi:hypothetical protein|nr:hypothetical protein [Arcobacteraceae bacterium]